MKRRYRSHGFSIPQTLTSKNPWARFGRNLSHFLMSFFINTSAYIGDALAAFCVWLFRQVFRRRKKSAERVLPEAYDTSQAESFLPIAEIPKVSFSDIAGLQKAKEQIYQRVILPRLHPKEALALKVKRGGGILLFGPPGNGKTMLAKAVANQVKAPFFNIQPSKLMSGDVGEAEKRLHALFQALKRYQCVVIFFDDMDGLFPARSKTRSTIMQRFLPQFLIETDGVESVSLKNTMLMIGATNEPWLIDPAVMRPGRFDVPIYVGLPDAQARFSILQKQLKERPIAPDINLLEIVGFSEGYSGSDLTAVIDRAAQRAFSRNIRRQDSKTAISPICHEDFLEALRDVRPSVGKDYLRRYEEYMESFQRNI